MPMVSVNISELSVLLPAKIKCTIYFPRFPPVSVHDAFSECSWKTYSLRHIVVSISSRDMNFRCFCSALPKLITTKKFHLVANKGFIIVLDSNQNCSFDLKVLAVKIQIRFLFCFKLKFNALDIHNLITKGDTKESLICSRF